MTAGSLPMPSMLISACGYRSCSCRVATWASDNPLKQHGAPLAARTALLQALVCHPGKLVMQTQLLIDIWGPSHKEDTHYLRIVIASLRKKLGDNPQQPSLIETESGIGYRFIGS